VTLDLPIGLLWTIPLATVRVLTFTLIAPFFGHVSVPLRVRVAMSVAIAALVAPLVAPLAPPPDAGPLLLAGVVGREAMIGGALGLGLRIVFDVFSPVGELVSLQGGLGAANLLDPSSGASSAVLGVLFQIFSLVVFLAVDGHHALLRGLVGSFERMPVGGPALAAGVFGALGDLGAAVFDVAAQLAAPVTIVMLVVNVGVGILGRAVPQLNLMAVQLPGHIALTLLILALTANVFGETVADILTAHVEDVLAIFLGGA